MQTFTTDLASIQAIRKAFYAPMIALDLATQGHISKFAESEIAFFALLTHEPSFEHKNPRIAPGPL